MGRHSPYYPWYPKDYSADPKVLAMTDDQDLAYRRLLDASWELGPLPDDVAQLASLARFTPERFAAAWRFPLVDCWKKRRKKSQPVLVNTRLESLRSEMISRAKTQQKNGRKGGRPPKAQTRKTIRENPTETHGLAVGFQNRDFKNPTETQPKPKKSHPDPDPDPNPKERSLGASVPLTPESAPVVWDSDLDELVIDETWLREEITDYQEQAGVQLTRGEYNHEAEQLRLKLLEDPRLRACRRKADGKPSAPTQFRRLATYTSAWFKRAVRYKAGARSRAHANSSQSRRERSDEALRAVMRETLEEETTP